MTEENLISAHEFCIYHNIGHSFILHLKEYGLVETVTFQQIDYIPAEQIEKLERILRIHRELEINLEGIDTINHMLQRVEQLQQEVIQLKNRLRRYEDLD